jgi:hypothetical protein
VSRPRGRPATSTSALVPAAARQDTPLSDLEAVLNADAIEVFAQAVGGRAQLADTLAIAGRGSDVERITTMLLDPRYHRWSLSRLCQTVGLTVADLFAAYRKAHIAKAHIEATHIIAGKLPPVVTDVMDKAIPRPVVCDLCHGKQRLNTLEPEQPPVVCPVCRGTGSVLSEPAVERHKLALELGQLLEKKGGLIVQQNNLAAASVGATAPGSLETLQQAVGDLLFGGGRRLGDIERHTPPADLPAEDDDALDLPVDDEPGGDAPDAPDDRRHPPPLDPGPPVAPDSPRATPDA